MNSLVRLILNGKERLLYIRRIIARMNLMLS